MTQAVRVKTCRTDRGRNQRSRLRGAGGFQVDDVGQHDRVITGLSLVMHTTVDPDGCVFQPRAGWPGRSLHAAKRLIPLDAKRRVRAS